MGEGEVVGKRRKVEMMEDEEGVHRNKEKERKDEKEKVRG